MDNKTADTMSPFALEIMQHKYAHTKKDGTKETWQEIAQRVAKNVMRAVDAPKALTQEIQRRIELRQFIPGGRYLAAAGRQYHQTQNCLLFRAEDSREGWSQLLYNASMGLMSGAGIGIDYSQIRPEGRPVRKTGGTATGPLALMQMINETGRGIMQGGSRRSAIWAGLSWKHADIHKFIQIKNWNRDVRDLKNKDFNFPATLDGTNVSVQLDDDFFAAYEDDKHVLHAQAQQVYWATLERMLKTGEPGFSVDTGKNVKETLRNACVPGRVEILTDQGYVRIDSVVGRSVNAWNGFEWSSVTPKETGRNERLCRVNLSSGQSLECTLGHEFYVYDNGKPPYRGGRPAKVAASLLKAGDTLVKTSLPVVNSGIDDETAYTQGFISGDGMDGYSHFLLYAPKYSCIPRLLGAASDELPNREARTFRQSFQQKPKAFVPTAEWSVQSRLDWLAGLADADGTVLNEGGIQICSVDREFVRSIQKMLTTLGVHSKINTMNIAGFREMPDGRGGKKEYFCQTSYRVCVCSDDVQLLTGLGLTFARLDVDDFTPNRNAARFVTVESVEFLDEVADVVYCFSEPLRHLGTFEGVVTGQCTEVSSADDSDICNLGSINLARIDSLEDFKAIVDCATAFLLAGTVYSDVPYAKVDQIRSKNRRLGLGLMGIHEWLLVRGKQYGPDEELQEYMEAYAQSTAIARKYADEWDLSHPIKTRAIAPTGTIGIVAETTTGIEPIFCAAYKRRYLKGSTWNWQYVVDPTAKRLVESGVNPDHITDAYSLSNSLESVERRVAFQAWTQKYVDHGISSTINLSAWGSEYNNANSVQAFGKMLMQYLPTLRGITCYPDGARGGQPLTAVSYRTAAKHVGEIFVEASDVCDLTKGGTCGS